MTLARSRNVRRVLVLSLALFLSLALVADQDMAARGGKGGGGKGKGGNNQGSVVSAELSVAPTRCAARSNYTISGSEFAPVPESKVLLWIRYLCAAGSVNEWFLGTVAQVDNAGTFTVTGTALGCAGTTEFQAVQTLADGTVIKGSASMEVY